MIRSNVLYSLYRQSDSLESFKRKVLANQFNRPADDPYSQGFPLFAIMRMFVEDDVDQIGGKDLAIEFLSACFEGGSTTIMHPFGYELHRLIEKYYAQYMYEDHPDYEKAYLADCEAAYDEYEQSCA